MRNQPEKHLLTPRKAHGLQPVGLRGGLLFLAFAVVCGLGLPTQRVAADEPAPLVREIFVPVKDLDALLESQPRRVLLSRQEYEELLKKAKKAPETHAPQSAAVIGAEYAGAIEEERARWTGKLAVEVLEDGLHALPLELSGVALRSAALDGKPAAIGRADDGRLMLLVEGKGRHELVLEMVSPLETTAARQALSFRLPYPAAAKFLLTVPGDVEVQSGATVVSRVVDEAARVTRFELLPPRGDVSLQMTLNSRLMRRDRVVVARSVLVDEVTQAYERLHATVSLAVLHQPVDRFRFNVPQGFEVTEVTSPLLARWGVETEAGRRVLDVRLREPTSQTVVLNLSATRTPPPLDKWTMPKLEPLEVVGQMAVVGLVVEDRLSTESVASTGLIGIDTSVLTRAIPPSVLRGEPGAPTIRPVVAYYAPQGDFSLAARFTKPPVETEVISNVLLVLEDRGLGARGLFLLAPKVEKLFSLDFSAPAGWHVTSVTGADGKPLSLERYGPADQAGRIRVALPQGVPPGQTCRVLFEATSAPAGWLAESEAAKAAKAKPTQVAFPVFAVAGATRDVGAVAVDARGDLVVRPEALKQLTPLDEKEKEAYGLAGVATSLAYRYESQPYQATFAVERTPPRLTARTFSFLRVEPDALIGHYEIVYRVDEARTRKLSLLLPKSVPATLRISGMDGLRVKEYTSEEAGEKAAPMRRWNVLLEEPRRGAVRLAVDFQQPLASAKGESQQVLQRERLPVVQADGVAYQSGLVAVEGSAELDVQIHTDARRVHVGELVDASYPPGKRLLGVFGFVGDPALLAIDVSRHPAYGLYPAIVENAKLTTQLSANGVSVTEAVFVLRNKDLYLAVELPEGSEAWAVLVDDKPVKPQRQDERLLVGVPAAPEGSTRTLKITYQTPVHSVGMIGEVDLPAPKLLLHADREAQGVEVPLVNLQWNLLPPSGYRVVRSRGTVVTELEPPERPAILNVLGGACGLALYRAHWEIQAAREAARRPMAKSAAGDATPYYMSDDIAHAPPGKKGRAGADRTGRFRAYESTAQEQSPADLEKAAEPVWDRALVPEAKAEPKPEPGGAAGVGFGSRGRGRGMGKAAAVTRLGPGGAPPRLGMPAEPTPVPKTAPPAPPIVVSSSPDGTMVTSRDSEALQGLEDSIEKFSVGKPILAPDYYTRGWQGRRSLKIDLAKGAGDEERMVTFQSLGVEPRLVITLANRPRFRMLGWALALGVALGGVCLTPRPPRTKVRYLVAVAVLATLLPLVPGWGELAAAGNLAVYAATALVLYYVLVAVIRWIVGVVQRRKAAIPTASAAASLFLLSCLLPIAAMGQESRTELNSVLPREAKTGPYVIQVVEPSEPVKVPEDAIILPYDPESQTGVRDATQVLVPYDKYVELWNRAYPDKRMEAKAPPLPYGLAGASYTTTLEGEEFLRIEGQLEIDAMGDQPVAIPLGLAGGVLARIELDGQPARLSILRVGPGTTPLSPSGRGAGGEGTPPQPAQQPAPQQSPQSGPAQAVNAPAGPVPPADGSLVALHVTGKGRHRLVLEVRMKLERSGGWRVMDGTLPAAPATAMAIVVPQAQTEVRLGELADRRSYETEKPGQRIETALTPAGRIHLQWRPKVGEGEVDRSLTAQSSAVLDVEEDGLRLVWQITLQFRRGQRESFTFHAPADYLVEKVEGGNVRGWEVRKDPKRQVVEVTLLKPARESERLVLRLWRAGRVGEGPLAEFDAPLVSVADAAMQTGQLAIRRSPLLEVRTMAATGVSRTDVSVGGPGAPGAPAGSEDSPLGVRPYEAYRYSATPFSLRLAAAPVAGRATAEVQTVLKIAELERTLESRIKLAVQDRPIHRIEVLLPEGLKLDQVSAPGVFHWTATPQEKRTLLTVYLAAGLAGDVPVVLRGTLRRPETAGQAALPNLEVRNVQRQQGDVAVQVDPGVEVKAEGLENCESVLLERVRDWLKPQQLQATALALHYERPDFRGTLRLIPREPIVTCQTVTNVRVTDRAVEETILLDFDIKQAGIRQLALLLPAAMSDSRVQVPMLRQKTVGKPEGGLVRVRLELQDPVMDKLRVSVQNDRLLTAGPHAAPIPVVQSADAAKVQTTRQFVALESAGRDEVIVKSAAGLEQLGSEQEAWRSLRELLGGGALTKAYLVQGGQKQPGLSFATEARKAVQTAGARIWLAETDLVCDANGAYRARQVYRLNNTINQYLEVELPEGATLWTARVADDLVKPVRAAAESDSRRVWIPLVKTAPGDRDYAVVLKYGGQMAPLGAIDRLTFPLMRTINVEVEQSQVRLHLPDTHRFFRFGGTMRLVTEDDLAAGRLSYERKQTERLLDTMRQGDPFGRALAANNLKVLVDESRAMAAVDLQSANVRQEAEQNRFVLRQAEEELSKLRKAPVRADGEDNRKRVNKLVQEQATKRASNVVQDLGGNFGVQAPESPPAARTDNAAQLNPQWLSKSQLENAEVAGKEDALGRSRLQAGGKPGGQDQKALEERMKTELRSSTLQEFQTKGTADKPEVWRALGADRIEADRKPKEDAAKSPDLGAEVDRYQKRLEQQEAAQPRGAVRVLPDVSANAAAKAMETMQIPWGQTRAGISDGQAQGGQSFEYTHGGLRGGGAARMPAGQMAGMGGMGKAPAFAPGREGVRVAEETRVVTEAGAGEATGIPAGLRSLDFELPTRGQVFVFTTPGRDIAVTARTVSRALTEDAARVGAVLLAAAVVLWIGRIASPAWFRWLNTRAGALLLICVGLLLSIAGFVVIGLLLLIAGIVLAVSRFKRRRAAAAAPANP